MSVWNTSAMGLRITSAGGIDVGATSGIFCLLPFDAPLDADAEIDEVPQLYGSPRITGLGVASRDLRLRVVKSDDSSLTDSDFAKIIRGMFDPGENFGGVRRLEVTLDGTPLYIDYYVEHRERTPGHKNDYTIDLICPMPYFQSATLRSSPIGTGTIIHNGNTRAYPTIHITDAGSVPWTRRTLTLSGTRGIRGFPYRMNIPGGAADTHVFVNGQPSAFNVAGGPVITTAVDVDPNQPTIVDVITGTGITNPLFNKLVGSVDTGSTSVVQYVTSLGTTFNSGLLYQWHPVILSPSGRALKGSYEVRSPNGIAITSLENALQNNGNGYILSSGAPINSVNLSVSATATALPPLSPVDARLVVYYQKPDVATWNRAFIFGSTAVVTGATRIAMILEDNDTSDTTWNGQVTINGTLTINTSVPFTVASQTSTLKVVAGSVVNTTTGQTVEFPRFIHPGTLKVVLSLDPSKRGVSTLPGPILGSVKYSSPDGFALKGGSNDLAVTGITGTMEFRDTYG